MPGIRPSRRMAGMNSAVVCVNSSRTTLPKTIIRIRASQIIVLFALRQVTRRVAVGGQTGQRAQRHRGGQKSHSHSSSPSFANTKRCESARSCRQRRGDRSWLRNIPGEKQQSISPLSNKGGGSLTHQCVSLHSDIGADRMRRRTTNRHKSAALSVSPSFWSDSRNKGSGCLILPGERQAAAREYTSRRLRCFSRNAVDWRERCCAKFRPVCQQSFSSRRS
jgi:hypothetical protein